MNLIALMGKSKSGKDSVGKMLCEARPGEGHTLAFADKLKTVCMDLFGLSHEDVYTEEGKARKLNLNCWLCPACQSRNAREERLEREVKILCRDCGAIGEKDSFKGSWTPRMILQHVGTEGCRVVDPNVWVNFALRDAASRLSMPKIQFVAITDCRFKSEAEAVWKAGGQVWRIRRPEVDDLQAGIAGHASETEMDLIPDSMFQQVIHNDHTLETLRQRVTVALANFFERR